MRLYQYVDVIYMTRLQKKGGIIILLLITLISMKVY